MSEIFERLAEPFPVESVKFRPGATTNDKSKGLALAYIDARDVMDRLDQVITPPNWQCKYSVVNGIVVCDIGVFHIRHTNNEDHDNTYRGDLYGWVWKGDGAGATDVEGQKGAMSDSFKRAAVKWGIGRYLYDLPNWWEELNDRKAFTDQALIRLRKNLEGSGGNPEGQYMALVREYWRAISGLKDALGDEDFHAAAEWAIDVPQQDMIALWKAPTKGGIFTTQERAQMKQDDFTQIFHQMRAERERG